MAEQAGSWQEADSRAFIDFGRYYVPDREYQLQTIGDLIPAADRPFAILELCCGDGTLATQLLERFPQATLYAYDGSEAMLARAQERLVSAGDRLQTRQFDLVAEEWRSPPFQPLAVVSSLAIHHLDGPQKRKLFRDILALLQPGGVFVIADVLLPESAAGVSIAAAAWDAAVRERALHFDGDLAAFEHFERDGWNMYRNPEPPGDDAVDKPSSLLEQLTWLSEAGFREVDCCWTRAGHAIFSGRKSESSSLPGGS